MNDVFFDFDINVDCLKLLNLGLSRVFSDHHRAISFYYEKDDKFDMNNYFITDCECLKCNRIAYTRLIRYFTIEDEFIIRELRYVCSVCRRNMMYITNENLYHKCTYCFRKICKRCYSKKKVKSVFHFGFGGNLFEEIICIPCYSLFPESDSYDFVKNHMSFLNRLTIRLFYKKFKGY